MLPRTLDLEAQLQRRVRSTSTHGVLNGTGLTSAWNCHQCETVGKGDLVWVFIVVVLMRVGGGN